MGTVKKIKKRSLYALGLIFTLVFGYIIKAHSADGEARILTRVPQALADVPPPVVPSGDSGVPSGDSGTGGGGAAGSDSAGDGGGGCD